MKSTNNSNNFFPNIINLPFQTMLINLLIFSLLILHSARPVSAIHDDQYGENDWHKTNIGKINYGKFNQDNKVGAVFTTISQDGTVLAALDVRQQLALLWRKTFSKGSKIVHFEYLGQTATSMMAPDTIFVLAEDKLLTIKSESGLILSESRPEGLDLTGFNFHAKTAEMLVFIEPISGQMVTVNNWQSAKNSHSKLKVDNEFKKKTSEDEEDLAIFYHIKGDLYKNGNLIERTSDLENPPKNCRSKSASNKALEICHNRVSVLNKDLTSEDISEKFFNLLQKNGNEEIEFGSLSFIKSDTTSASLTALFLHDSSNLFKVDFSGERAVVTSIKLQGKVSSSFVTESNVYIFTFPTRSVHPKLVLSTYSTRTLKPSDLSGLSWNPDNVSTFKNVPNFIQVNEFTSKSTLSNHARIITQTALDLQINYNNKFKREEGLSNLNSAILLNLPEDVEINETPTGNGFFNRLSTHFAELYEYFYAKIEITLLYLYNLEPYNDWSKFPEAFANAGTDTSKMAASAFGVRKLIVTHRKNSDTIYILDSKTGEIFKKVHVPSLETASKVILLTDNTPSSNSNSLEVVVIAINDETENSNNLIKLIKFNAAESDSTFEDFTKDFKPHVKVAHILEHTVIFEDGTSFELKKPASKNVHFSEVDKATGVVKGNVLFNQEGKESKIVNLWKFSVEEGHEIVSFKKAKAAVTNAIGRALKDRSIQYKYLNPHMISVITQWVSTDNVPTLTLYIIDGITGNLLYSQNQANAKTPVKLAQIDNWVAFTYWDTKKRRHNVESIEFYKGRAHSFSQMSELSHKTDKFTSSGSKIGANDLTVLKQGYILPFEPSNLEPTFTKKGITQRSLLIPVADKGQLVQVKHIEVDARRVPKTYKYDENGNVAVDNKVDFDDSKQLPGTYMPEIILTPESLISTNRTISGIKSIVVSPAKLESTCVAFAFGGLDVYFTNNIAPSRAFDKLDGFGKVKLTLLGACIGLFLLTLFLKHQSQWDQIQRSWK